MFLSLRSGLSVISRGVIAGAQQSYNRILKLFPTVSSLAPASTRPVQQGQVCEFDGVNDYINCGNSTSFDFTDLINIQFYLKLNGTGLQNFISKGVGTTTNYSVDYSNGLRFFGYESGSPAGSLSGYTLSTGQWYHIQCIKDATHFRIFVDGIEVRTVASTATLTTNSVSFLIGKRATLHCDGYMSGVIISDVAQYNLNHASGTTAYDSSGNGNDGTLQNGAAFVVDNTLPPEADKLNLEGYTDDSGVLKPRDESDPTNDIDGNPLQYSGSVYPRRPEFRNSYAASFDGVDDYILSSELIRPDLDVEIIFKVNSSTGASKAIFGGGGGSVRFYAQYNQYTGGTLHVVVGAYQSPSALNSVTGVSEDVWHTLRMKSNGDWYLNGIFQANVGDAVTTTPANTSDNKLNIGRRGDSTGTHSNVSVASFKVIDDGDLSTHYPLTEGAGDTAHDISGNGNNGTINNASTGTEGAGFWAGRIDGEANALNNNNGFSKRMLFDGVDDEVELPNDAFNAQSAGYIEADVLCVGGGNYTVFGVASSNTSNQILSMQILDTNKIRVGYGGANFVQGTTVLTSGERYRIKWESTGTEWKIYIDGVEETTNVQIGSNTGQWFDEITSGSTRYSVGLLPRSTGNSSIFKGTVYNLIINNGTADIASYNGYGNTNADWTDQIGSNNGTVNGSPALLRIPADTSEPTKDVFGDTLTNPAITDGYNGAETELDAYNIAEGDNPSPATSGHSALDAIEFGTDFASNDAAYMRLKSSTENDRLITFEDDLTGGDKTLAEKFTETP